MWYKCQTTCQCRSIECLSNSHQIQAAAALLGKMQLLHYTSQMRATFMVIAHTNHFFLAQEPHAFLSGVVPRRHWRFHAHVQLGEPLLRRLRHCRCADSSGSWLGSGTPVPQGVILLSSMEPRAGIHHCRLHPCHAFHWKFQVHCLLLVIMRVNYRVAPLLAMASKTCADAYTYGNMLKLVVVVPQFQPGSCDSCPLEGLTCHQMWPCHFVP